MHCLGEKGAHATGERGRTQENTEHSGPPMRRLSRPSCTAKVPCWRRPANRWSRRPAGALERDAGFLRPEERAGVGERAGLGRRRGKNIERTYRSSARRAPGPAAASLWSKSRFRPSPSGAATPSSRLLVAHTSQQHLSAGGVTQEGVSMLADGRFRCARAATIAGGCRASRRSRRVGRACQTTLHTPARPVSHTPLAALKWPKLVKTPGFKGRARACTAPLRRPSSPNAAHGVRSQMYRGWPSENRSASHLGERVFLCFLFLFLKI